jgi:hypothetical protein
MAFLDSTRGSNIAELDVVAMPAIAIDAAAVSRATRTRLH